MKITKDLSGRHVSVADIRLTYSLTRPVVLDAQWDNSTFMETWVVSAHADLHGLSENRTLMGTLEIKILPFPLSVSQLGDLDADEGTLAEIGVACNDWAEDGEFDYLLIGHRMRLKPAWQGYGLGPLILGTVILQLRKDVMLAAIYPGPLVNRRGGVAAAKAKLAATWSTLGFEPIGDGSVHVLNLMEDTFEMRMTEVRQNIIGVK